MSNDAGSTELLRLFTEIENAADRHVGVESYEQLLVDLLDVLESDRIERVTAIRALELLTKEWPAGAAEILEFTMRKLRWPEIRTALDEHRRHGEDFRTRNLAAQVLESFEADWPVGQIYRAYRSG